MRLIAQQKYHVIVLQYVGKEKKDQCKPFQDRNLGMGNIAIQNRKNLQYLDILKYNEAQRKVTKHIADAVYLFIGTKWILAIVCGVIEMIHGPTHRYNLCNDIQ
jgi:hypothetical protein